MEAFPNLLWHNNLFAEHFFYANISQICQGHLAIDSLLLLTSNNKKIESEKKWLFMKIYSFSAVERAWNCLVI